VRYRHFVRIFGVILTATIGVAFVVSVILWSQFFSGARPSRAFYYWKTEWRPSQATLQSLAQARIDRLYMRFFDVDWDDAGRTPQPVSPLKFESTPPTGVEIVPVVYIVNAVFLKLAYADVSALADRVVTKVKRMAEVQSIAFNQLQLDCDWTESSRRNYFHFVDLVNRKLEAQRKFASATIRLHQIKYAERTGIPPVGRGMLMFYNFGKIQADTPKSSIFNAEDASRYSSYIASYPLKLDVVLPAFSWSVHSREGRVLGLLENLAEDEIAAFDGFRKLSPNHYVASRSFFFRGRYFMDGDLLLMETTTPDMTFQAAVLAKRGAGWLRTYGTVALFDLDEKHLEKYSGEDIEGILAQF